MIRPDIIEALDRYAEQGGPLGGFLEAVLSNDLVSAAFRADIDNRAALAEIALHVSNRLPAICWGSPDVYRAWVASCRATQALVAHDEETIDRYDRAMEDLNSAHRRMREWRVGGIR